MPVTSELTPPLNMLSDLYREKAIREWNSLSGYQLSLVDEYREIIWENGVIYAFLEIVRQKVIQGGVRYKNDLAGRLGVDPTNIDHLCKHGGISAAKWIKLTQQPEFSGRKPSDEAVAAHQWRDRLTWLRRHVWHDKSFKHSVRWDELLFIAEVHKMDIEDASEAFKACPESWRTGFSTRKEKWTAGKLLDAMNSWGPSYRLAILEPTHNE